MSDQLREQLKAAFEEHREDPAPDPVAPPVVAEAAPEPVVAEAAPDTEKADKVPTAPVRDEKGKFVSKEGAASAPEAIAVEATPETAPAADQDAPQEPIKVPSSLPAPLKAKFKDLPPEWQTAFHKRDEDVNAAKAQWDTKAQRLNRYDDIIAPHKDAWAIQGLNEDQALSRLVAAEKQLREQPYQAIQYLAQSYGVDLRHYAGQAPAQGQPQPQGQQAPQVPAGFDAILNPLMEEVRTLKESIAQQSQSSEAAQLAQAQAQVDAFANDPANLYFENVRPQMAAYITARLADNYADAYQMAIWANPEIRPLLMQEQADKTSGAAAKKAAEEAARQKAADAKRSSGSVTGAPTPGAVAPNGGAKASIREELLAARESLGARL